MSLPSAPTIPKDGSLTFYDGAGTPLSSTLLYEDGDLQVSGFMHGQMSVQEFKSRGMTYALRQVESQNLEVQFSAHLVGLTDATDFTIMDVVRRQGTWASATSTSAGKGNVFTVKAVFSADTTAIGATTDASLTLYYLHLTADLSEGAPGKISLKGTAYNLGGTCYGMT
jgi:hypothetical protein